MNRLACSLLFAAALALASTASAQPAPAGEVTTFALVIGSNAGGPGQATLHYAEEDAKRVGSLLVELGGYAQDHVDTVLSPTPDELRKHLDALAKRVGAESAAGRRSRVTFYYSGHARATALDLGSAQLPLAELRTRLFASTAQVTVVVLDACQSGAFSQVKGGAPAADFSYNSKSQLDATGVAVLASSTGSELSQESEELRGSYFTHNLLTGMRGAGDANGDGQVSIDEAYRYAYHQTLLATAETAVGGQHVTFEVDLKGHGEVPMSFPRASTASLLLPAGFDGSTIIENTRAKTVIAELYKAKADAIRIAVPPGEYDVLVRQGTELARCHVMTPVTGTATVDITRCPREKVVAVVTKGGELTEEQRVDAWTEREGTYSGKTRIEVALTVGDEHHDAYTQELTNFQYREDSGASDGGLLVTVLHRLTRNLWVGGLATYETSQPWLRQDQLSSLSIRWTTGSAMATAQGLLPFAQEGRLSRLALYGDAALGLAIARTTFHSMTTEDTTSREWFGGPAFAVGAGIKFESSLLGGVGFSMGYQFQFLHAIDNLDGDTHASGGHRLTLGLFYAF
ncbi:MAG TPA: caspase family protein [Kofleriaceae bacterium]|jgi:hypothetical protein